ncbi:MAG TPA: glycosyltransferase [Rhizomicrobium sp.]|jgi:glycosyltransferase involved in cell wall biosynthesis|nr:glycosyltransferase [Rhizomicrobium sp.]
MRVLHVIDSLVGGGKERQFVELLKGLRREGGIACHAVVMSEVIEYEDFHRLDLPVTVLPRHNRYDFSIFSRLHAVMREFRPDIVQSWNSMCSIYAAPLAKLSGAKFIDGFVRAAAENRNLRDPDYFRSRLTLPLTDVVVGNSRAGLSAYSIPARKGICIYNGFDPSRIRQLPPPEAMRVSLGVTTPHVVGMVASFSHWKDYDTYFDAAVQLCLIRNDVTFVAIGTGPHFPDYQARFPVERFPYIRLLGRRTDVESIVNVLSVGVLTSNKDTHGEGISNAIMEYMALGKPVIATDCGGNSELISEDETGYLIANRDVAGLANRLNKLLDDTSLAHALGEAGRRRIRGVFDLERMTAAYASLYNNLLAPGRTAVHAEAAAGKLIHH